MQQIRVQVPGDGVGQGQKVRDRRLSGGGRQHGGVGQQMRQADHVPRTTRGASDPHALFVKQVQSDQVAHSAAGPGHAGGDVHQTSERIPARHADPNGLRRIHEQRATDRHLALEHLGHQAIAARGDFTGDGLGRIARQIVAEVEKLKSGSKLCCLLPARCALVSISTGRMR